MSNPTFITRRAAVAGALLALTSGFASAQSASTFRTVVVDTSGLESVGGRGVAATIKPLMQKELAEAFAGRITGKGSAPTLVVRINSISLAIYGSGSDLGYTDTDYLDGEAFVLPAGSRSPSKRVPLLAANGPDGAGAYYLPDFDRRRMARLCGQLAVWLARQV